MASSSVNSRPVALILGHSFVRRLKRDLESHFDDRALLDFGLHKDAVVHLFGVGGRTVPKMVKFDLGVVAKMRPNIIILELGTNDLSLVGPEMVGSAIDDLVNLLIEEFSVSVIGVCKTIPRHGSEPEVLVFNDQALILNNYLDVVFEQRPQVFAWQHKGFVSPSVCPYLPDGVHLNHFGQYALYRSYRGAVIKALRML